MPADAAASRPRLVLILLGMLAGIAVLGFMTLGARGSWAFVLPFRGVKLAGLLLVAYAVAVSTVLFQTVTDNRILTPSIMGFDALYVLIQTTLFTILGSRAAVTIDPRLLFGAQVAIMVVFSGLLYRWLFGGETRGLHFLVLVGVVFGVFFRSLSGFMQRVLDPNEFMVLQDTLFASFNAIDRGLLLVSGLIVGLATLIGWRLTPRLDVLGLGRPLAINLGLDYRRDVMLILGLVAVLVSVSTALVGPVTFFGLLVASLAHVLVGSAKHRHVLPAAILLAVICLVGGQTILERVFAFDTALSIIIEFVGGIAFLVLVLRKDLR